MKLSRRTNLTPTPLALHGSPCGAKVVETLSKMKKLKNITNIYITMAYAAKAAAFYSLVFINETAFLCFAALTALLCVASMILINSTK